MDRFVLISPGRTDSNVKGQLRVPPDCYARIAELSRKTGMSMCRIAGQCIDFALERLELAEG